VSISADNGEEVTTELCCNAENQWQANPVGRQSPRSESELTVVFPRIEVHQVVQELEAEGLGAVNAEGDEPRDAVSEISLAERSEVALQKVESAADIALQKMDFAAGIALLQLEKAANVRRQAEKPVKLPPSGENEPEFVVDNGKKTSDVSMEKMAQDAHEALKILEDAAVAAYRKVEEAAETARQKIADLPVGTSDVKKKKGTLRRL